MVEKDRGVIGVRTDVQPCREGTRRRAADRDQAFLAAFAAYAQHAVLNVAQVQSNKFGGTESASVEKFEEGAIASGEYLNARRKRIEKLFQLFRGGHLRDLLL